MRKTIKRILEKNGLEVVGEAENGLIGFFKYQELQPDIVTIDIRMPEIDGILALKMIKHIDSQANVVMVSSMGQEVFVKEAIKTGAKDFIVTPFTETLLIEILSKLP
jgi:two-component system chemotaxis response regulator CheY